MVILTLLYMADTRPLVSVIALCYNHAVFVEDALRSVLQQTYEKVELIVVDDASTDGSAEKIQAFAQQHPAVQCLLLETNQGNCKAFNRGLALAQGTYVVDFATDDLMYPHRIAQQVELLETKGLAYGVAFSDADLIDEQGEHIRTYYPRTPSGKFAQKIPSGEVYAHLVKWQFICTPTMMMRKTTFYLLILSLLGLTGCLNYGNYRVESDYSYAGNFNDYKSFNFFDELLEDTSQRNVILANAIRSRLNLQGYKLTAVIQTCWCRTKFSLAICSLKAMNSPISSIGLKMVSEMKNMMP